MSALKFTLGGSRRRIGLARLAAGAALVVGALGLAVPAASAASAAPASGGVGWLRLAHLSPNTPAVDCYLYSFDNPNAKIVLHHVAYGAVSPYEQVPAGEYTVAMRGAGAAPASKPVLSASVDVQPGGAYTVAGMGPTPACGCRSCRTSSPPRRARRWCGSSRRRCASPRCRSG